MNFFKNYIAYLKDNPQGLWFKFKRKWFGWGWVPVKWQGWAVIAAGIALAVLGVSVGEADDAPGAALMGILFGLALLFFFCFKKGEKPRWSWGDPRK